MAPSTEIGRVVALARFDEPDTKEDANRYPPVPPFYPSSRAC